VPAPSPNENKAEIVPVLTVVARTGEKSLGAWFCAGGILTLTKPLRCYDKCFVALPVQSTERLFFNAPANSKSFYSMGDFLNC
jgi:hypothetical protein